MRETTDLCAGTPSHQPWHPLQANARHHFGTSCFGVVRPLFETDGEHRQDGARLLRELDLEFVCAGRPDLELRDWQGERVQLSSYEGKVLLIEPIGMT